VEARERLEAERRSAAGRLAALRRDFTGIIDASRDSNADDEHDPEGATIACERQQVDGLIRQTEKHLVEIESALVRLEAGAYGVCERCGRPVAAGRLEARPTARTCVTCPSSGHW